MLKNLVQLHGFCRLQSFWTACEDKSQEFGEVGQEVVSASDQHHLHHESGESFYPGFSPFGLSKERLEFFGLVLIGELHYIFIHFVGSARPANEKYEKSTDFLIEIEKPRTGSGRKSRTTGVFRTFCRDHVALYRLSGLCHPHSSHSDTYGRGISSGLNPTSRLYEPHCGHRSGLPLSRRITAPPNPSTTWCVASSTNDASVRFAAFA